MEIIIAILVLLIYAAFMRSIYEMRTFEVNKINIMHELASDREPVFVYFSDLHGASYGADNHKLIEKINSINPDAIIIGGDMIVGSKEHYKWDSKENLVAASLITKLCEKYPVYYGFGNHETRTKVNRKFGVDFNSYIYSIQNKNLHILCNKHEYVTYKGTRFCIYGLESDTSYYSKKKIKKTTSDYVEKCLGESPEHKHSIPLLISHNPDAFEACAKWGAEYVFSGHNHGGFIRLPLIGGIIASNYRLFPKYTAGIYKSKHHRSTMILSKGLGTHTIKFRLFNKPEIVVVTFKNKKS